MLNASHVTVRVGAQVLLDNFTAAFAPGELTMVVGPNGAGKTTLLRCLDGELTPSDGGVELARRALREWPRARLARMRAALPQRSTLDFPFSVADVVLMGRMPHSTSDARNRAIADEVLALCDCAGLGARAYTTLSGGEQQRVQTARVLAQIWDGPDGRFLLLDEPVSALDLSHQYALLRLLKRLSRDERIGIVCTLHNLNLVAQFADRAIIIDRGMTIADGAPIEVFTEATVSNVFNLDIAVRRHPDAAEVPLLIPHLQR
ncbi:MAG: heme ABC transporter ATP-binding protein [bacterium]